ncbi:hypothetical protein MBLNU457_2094t1 [Dothideomycetes sp. NU457]
MAPNQAASAQPSEDEQLQANTMIAQAARAAAGNAEGQTQAESQNQRPGQPPTVNVEEPEDDVPPPYGALYEEVVEENSRLGVDTKASITDDGRVNININQRAGRLSSLLAPALRNQLEIQDKEPAPPPYLPASLGGEPGQAPPPPLNVVIQVVGSRGDVQPFIALGKVLKDTYGHRVRLATHPVFKQFVTENGLEFFSIGGDPSELMAFMVKNPGLMPGFDTLRSGDVGKRRKEIAEMIKGCWRSCIEVGDGSSVEVTGDTQENWLDDGLHGNGNRPPVDPKEMPFVCDAIIANPPSFAHIHCAEKLGCPLHIMFTMPYSPTQAFPHPLANIQSSNADTSMTNYLSYAMVETMTWQGLGDVINRFRQSSLGLEPVSLMWAPNMLSRLKVPFTYCFSPALIPKPKDWGNHISLSGFYFLSLATNFTPEPELQAFLDAGPPPVYIGFGSIVVDDPNAMTKMIFDAVKKSGQRALVSKGWGGFGADQLGIPEGVMMLGNVPHDWLFKHVSCVVHHGGAGTTAAGIACGKPTVIVPFFGDQPWWAAMVAKAGAGPPPTPYKELDADKLADKITAALQPDVKERAQELANKISHEQGTQSGSQSFHQFLNVDNLRCTIAPSRAAVWRLKRTNVRFSALAATVLGNEGLLDFKDLKLYRAREYETDDGPWDPITGGGTALIGTMSSMMLGVADLPIETLRALKIHPDSVKKKKAKDGSNVAEQERAASGLSSPASPELTGSQSASPGRAGSNASSQFNFSESLANIPSVEHKEGDRPSSSKSSGSDFKSLALALGGQLSERMMPPEGRNRRGSSPRSGRSRASSTSEQGRTSPQPPDHLGIAIGTGKGVGRVIGAGVKSPMDFTYALAKGFRNAPKLYGDETVRKSEPVTNFKSGLKAAGKEFGYGMYDGITGLVTQPMALAKKEGAAGFLKGVGMGIGGIVLKPGAAFWSIPGYTMKGIYKELQAFNGSSVQNYIIAARTSQGYADWHASSPQERADIIERWTSLRDDIKRKKNPDEALASWAAEQKAKRAAWQEQQKKKIKESLHSQNFASFLHRNRDGSGRSRSGSDAVSHGATSSTSAAGTSGPSRQAATSTAGNASSTHDAEIDEAIHRSVAESSRGNAEEDAMIERALRASILELQAQRPPAHHNDESDDEEGEAIRTAMAASVIEAERYRSTHANEDHDQDLERAIQESLSHSKQKQPAEDPPEYDDEDLAEAMRNSKHPALRSVFDLNAAAAAAGDDQVLSEAKERQETGHSGAVNYEEEDEPDGTLHPEKVAGQSLQEQENSVEDEELHRAMQESLKSHSDQRSEEEIVLEYVKKQSLLEEEHRRKIAGDVAGGSGTGAGSVKGTSANEGQNEDDDEELRRAMAASLGQEKGR